jgi:hypothetical protein
MSKLSDATDKFRAEQFLKAQQDARLKSAAIKEQSFTKYLDVLKTSVINLKQDQSTAIDEAIKQEQLDSNAAQKKNTKIFLGVGVGVILIAFLLLKK